MGVGGTMQPDAETLLSVLAKSMQISETNQVSGCPYPGRRGRMSSQGDPGSCLATTESLAADQLSVAHQVTVNITVCRIVA